MATTRMEARGDGNKRSRLGGRLKNESVIAVTEGQFNTTRHACPALNRNNRANIRARGSVTVAGISDPPFLRELVHLLGRAIDGNRTRLAGMVAETLARHWPEGGVL